MASRASRKKGAAAKKGGGRQGRKGPGRPVCGLCGKKGKLTRTNCCGNWICDDHDKYVLFSYARNSCSRNHDRYTLCAHHFNEGHSGGWQDCQQCLDDFEAEMYSFFATNEYNFEKLENPPAFEPKHCKGCGVRIVLAEDGYTLSRGEYYCEECSARRWAETEAE